MTVRCTYKIHAGYIYLRVFHSNFPSDCPDMFVDGCL
jgi:hypothetical protein